MQLFRLLEELLDDHLQRQLSDYEDDPDLTVETLTAFIGAIAGYLRKGWLPLPGQAPFPGL